MSTPARMFDGIEVRRLLGRCADGAERGAGRHWHAVEMGVALCGKRVGPRSAGWSWDEGTQITCLRCLRRIAARYHRQLLEEMR